MEQPAEKNTPQENHANPGATEPDQAGAQARGELELLQNQLKDKEQKYLYLYAEFENFKKRAMKERSDLIKYGWEGAARELLEIVDNLERALEHMPQTGDHFKTLEQGLHMVLNQFKAALEKQGIQEIETASKEFDPNLHEAVARVPSDQPEGRIIREESRGYTLHGRLLRPARVQISSGKTEAEPGT